MDRNRGGRGRAGRARERAREPRRAPPGAHALARAGHDALLSLASKVGRAIRSGRALDPAVVKEAQALHDELLKGDLRDVLVRLREASKDSPLLVRLFLRDRALLGIPWEALCRPGTTEGFLGTDPKVLVARGVELAEPWEPREVRGAVRVLAIAPGSDERGLVVLKEALAPSIEAGEVEWLDPIAGPDISARVLFDRLRRGKTPHVCTGSVTAGSISGGPSCAWPTTRTARRRGSPPRPWARELSASFCEELRLVILEACEGAKAGAFGSAAEILAKAGADAVVAHLWPVKADVARLCSSEIYRSLTGAERGLGDIGASVAAARRTLLAQSAEAFSPSCSCEARTRSSSTSATGGSPAASAAELQGPRARAPKPARGPFTMVLGDVEDDRAALPEPSSSRS